MLKINRKNLPPWDDAARLKHKHGYQKAMPPDYADIYTMFRNGYSATELAQLYSVSRQRIYYLCRLLAERINESKELPDAEREQTILDRFSVKKTEMTYPPFPSAYRGDLPKNAKGMYTARLNGATYAEIAAAYGVSKQRAHAIVQSTANALRRWHRQMAWEKVWDFDYKRVK